MIILAAKKIFLAALWSKNALFVEVRKRLRKALVMVKNDGIVRTPDLFYSCQSQGIEVAKQDKISVL